MAHKAHVKEAMNSTNRKDWEIQIMSVHARKDAIVHHTKMMLGKNICCLIFVILYTSDFFCFIQMSFPIPTSSLKRLLLGLLFTRRN